MKEEIPDQYGNTEGNWDNCCFPNCGCDGARLCGAKNGASNIALTLNLEKRTPEMALYKAIHGRYEHERI